MVDIVGIMSYIPNILNSSNVISIFFMLYIYTYKSCILNSSKEITGIRLLEFNILDIYTSNILNYINL